MKEWAAALLAWVEGLGPLGPILYGVVFAVAVVVMLPTWELSMGAGILFGATIGTPVAFASTATGAIVAFLLGRTVAGDPARAFIDRHPRLKAVDDEIERRGWLAAFLLRLSPLVPFNVVNYVLGVTRLSFVGYVVSLPGMLPVLAFWVTLGSTVGSLTLDTERTTSPLEWVILGVGLAATVAVIVWLLRVARAR